MIREILKDRLFLFLCFIFVVISLSYPLTVTFDSGHYMFLADVLNDRAWSEWDPIRGVIFPLFLSLSTSLLGRNPNALLMPMIFAQLVLFLFSLYFILSDTEIFQTFHRKIIITLVFLLVMLDPVIMGYYHTVLTEFFAATLAAVSCYFAYKLYRFSDSLPTLSKPLILSFVYFLFAIPVAWHLKQPYVGTALFPFLLACFLIVVRDFRKREMFSYLFFANVMVIASLGISIIFWAGFLRLAGMPPKPERELSGFFNDAYEAKSETVLASPTSFAKYVTKNYLAFSNFFWYERDKELVVAQPSLTRAFQNRVIASRMYELYGESNMFYMTEELKTHVQVFSSNYFPPLWFNEIQVAQRIKSYFLFTATYLLIPFVFLFSVFILIKKKAGSTFIFICSGTVFLNALFHSVFIDLPLDRYLFWGYSLNIVVFIIIFIKVIQKALYASAIRKQI